VGYKSAFAEHLSALFVTVIFILISLAAMVLSPLPMRAQSVDDVHLQPRNTAPTERSAPPAAPADHDLNLKVNAKTFVKNVELVLVPVTITNPMNQAVTGLERENFRVYEGEQEQAIRYFSSEDAPLSLGVIFDVSESMADKIDKAREAVMGFLRAANPQDEFCLVTFSDRPHWLVDFGEPLEIIEHKLDYAVPKGRTALLDAIYLGMTEVRRASHVRKALLIISDGGDNRSRFKSGEIKNLAMEADVQIYSISIFNSVFKTLEEERGQRLLTQLADVTGGRAFTVRKINELPEIAAQIARELRNQYVLGYRPSSSVRDGKWHRIKVKLIPPQGSPRLRVSAKTGYYAPGQ
jgi:Ca-activated chloride channel family protein